MSRDKINEIVVTFGQLTSKYPDKQHLMGGDKTFISASQYEDLIKALADSEAERVKALEKEILELRSYCMITFGESHPEIKKCIHEVQAEERVKPVLEVYEKYGKGISDAVWELLPEKCPHVCQFFKDMWEATKKVAEGSGECSECGASVKENRRHWIKCPNRGGKG